MLISLLPRLIQHANAAVHDRTLAPEFRGKKMATTVVACALAPRPGHRLARGRLALLPRAQGQRKADHARSHLGQRATQDGTDLRRARLPTSDSRHVLIRSLGPEMFVSPDTTALTLQAGDVLVLCTDGLHDEMPEVDDRCDRLAKQAHRRDRPGAGCARRRD